jgi:hypothetical protein
LQSPERGYLPFFGYSGYSGYGEPDKESA